MTHQSDIPASVLINSNHNHNLTVVTGKFGFKARSDFPKPIKKNQLIALKNKILKTSTSYQQGIHARIFCRRWFGLEATNEYGRPRFTEEQIIAMESEHGYREKCINLIARILQIKPNTIHRWGKGVAFDKIPTDKRQKYEIYLAYVDAIRIITTSLEELEADLLLKILQRLESSNPASRSKTVSHTEKYRNNGS